MGLWTEYIVRGVDLAPRTAGPCQLTSMGDRYPFCRGCMWDWEGTGEQTHKLGKSGGRPGDKQCTGVRGGVSGTRRRVKKSDSKLQKTGPQGEISSAVFRGYRKWKVSG